ncbi:GTP-binding protein [bacterium]|nr:GTP-binding protein [bacterium]
MIPTILLTGFLAAGKTTLMNRLIAHYKGRRTVVLVNEFGQVGIDGALLIEGDYRLVELNKGSLFCICVRTDFIDEVERIATQLQPELLLIEATGLADTTEMERMLALPHLRRHIDLQACLALVDATSFFKIVKFLNAPIAQVKSADLILLNKTDLATPQELAATKQTLAGLALTAPVIETQHARFSLDQLDRVRRPRHEAVGEVGDGRPDPVQSKTFTGVGSLSRKTWQALCEKIKDNRLRAKGFVTIENQVFYVDADMERWTETSFPAGEKGKNQLVVIGLDIPDLPDLSEN